MRVKKLMGGYGIAGCLGVNLGEEDKWLAQWLKEQNQLQKLLAVGHGQVEALVATPLGPGAGLGPAETAEEAEAEAGSANPNPNPNPPKVGTGGGLPSFAALGLGKSGVAQGLGQPKQAEDGPKTTVVRVNKKNDNYDIYIGRPSKWGNPFVIGKDGNREEVIATYRAWILLQPELLSALGELKGKKLGCFCKPAACHGDVLVELIKEYADDEDVEYAYAGDEDEDEYEDAEEYAYAGDDDEEDQEKEVSQHLAQVAAELLPLSVATIGTTVISSPETDSLVALPASYQPAPWEPQYSGKVLAHLAKPLTEVVELVQMEKKLTELAEFGKEGAEVEWTILSVHTEEYEEELLAKYDWSPQDREVIRQLINTEKELTSMGEPLFTAQSEKANRLNQTRAKLYKHLSNSADRIIEESEAGGAGAGAEKDPNSQDLTGAGASATSNETGGTNFKDTKTQTELSQQLAVIKKALAQLDNQLKSTGGADAFKEEWWDLQQKKSQLLQIEEAMQKVGYWGAPGAYSPLVSAFSLVVSGDSGNGGSNTLVVNKEVGLAAQNNKGLVLVERFLPHTTDYQADFRRADGDYSKVPIITSPDFKPYLTFLARSDKTAERWGEASSKQWLAGLSQPQIETLRFYTTSAGYHLLNGYLSRRQNPDGSLRYTSDQFAFSYYTENSGQYIPLNVEEAVAALDTTLRAHQFKENLVVYRGERYSLAHKYKEAAMSGWLKPGMVFHYRRFLSTTVSQGCDAFSNFDDGVQFVLKVPKGSPGAFIGKISALPDEREILFPAGSRVRIDSYAFNRKRGKMEVQATYLPPRDWREDPNQTKPLQPGPIGNREKNKR